MPPIKAFPGGCANRGPQATSSAEPAETEHAPFSHHVPALLVPQLRLVACALVRIATVAGEFAWGGREAGPWNSQRTPGAEKGDVHLDVGRGRLDIDTFFRHSTKMLRVKYRVFTHPSSAPERLHVSGRKEHRPSRQTWCFAATRWLCVHRLLIGLCEPRFTHL